MKRQPTDKEKQAFIKALATVVKDADSAEGKAAKAELDRMHKEFDCGCKFRDVLFKRLYQASRKGDLKGAVQNAKLFASSFRHDSLKGILKGLFNG